MARTQCWLCHSASAQEWKARNLPTRLSPDDLKITDAHYGRTLRLLRCKQCGFIFADGAELAELEALYGQLVDEAYADSSEARTLQMRWMLERIQRQAPVASLLDVGCAAGLLLEQARELGISASGVEPSAALVGLAQAKGLRALHGVLPHAALDGQKFDLVSLMDVIEHVSDPVGLLRLGAAHLSEGGALLVVTPDIGSAVARLLGKRWWHLRVAHVCYFDARTLEAAAREAGLAVVQRFRPLWFFPVSYLMERVLKYVPLPMPDLEGTWLGTRVVPLQLGDSWAFVLRKQA
jgi:2-polyprenyl-3-methyl-5-hydroxy-6-metoxy-1,4-benzoquinol methylase